MKKLNILILDTDDRGSQCGLPFHYRSLGHNVYMPRPFCEGIPWKRTAIWPRMLMRPMHVERRNINSGIVKREDLLFGEDNFLFDELNEINALPPYDSAAECDLVDLAHDKVSIDAFHTTSNAVGELNVLFDYVKKYAPNAKWISSSLNHWDHNPYNLNPKNVVRVLPANYTHAYADKNVCDCYRHHTEFELYSVDRSKRLEGNRYGFASFNHNYAIRQPAGFELFTKMNRILANEGQMTVDNYGGNIRGHGSDARYSGDQGITGKFVTLNPRKAAMKYLEIRAVVHFKSTDWGGGVPAYARFAATPFITTSEFIAASHSHKTLLPDINCLVVDNAEEAAHAVTRLQNDDHLVKRLSFGMNKIHEELFSSEEYWNAWERMLANLQ